MTKKHLICFLALTFAISWGIPGVAILLSVWFPGVPFSLEMYTPLYFVSVWGPAVAALVVIGRRAGFPGVGSYMRRMLDWRIGIRWWLFALLGIPAMYLGGALIEHAFLGSPQALSWYKGPWLVFIFAFLLRAAAGPVEEFGWRGFALPMMQRIMSPGMAVVVLALMHGLWHAPAFVVGFASNTHFAAELPFHIAFGRFMINIFIITVFLNITYNATGGKLTSAFLIHWMLNGVYPWEGQADLMTGQIMVTGAAAVVMLLTIARKWLSAEHAATDVLPDGAKNGAGPIPTGRGHTPSCYERVI